LIWSRTTFRYKKMLRFLSVLPIITPPFVIGLSLILIFGRSGVINQFVEYAFGVQLGRWIYGLPGVLLAQVFAFTPIAFLVLFGGRCAARPGPRRHARHPVTRFCARRLFRAAVVARAQGLYVARGQRRFGSPDAPARPCAPPLLRRCDSVVGAHVDHLHNGAG